MSIGSCENKTILKLCDRKRPIYKSRIFNHNWIQLLYYITALIHSQKTFFLKGSLFLKLKFLRISQAMSRKQFWTNILLLLLQTANTMVETRAGAESQVASRKSDVTRHDDVTITVTRPLCHDDAMRIPEGGRRLGVVSGNWARRIHDSDHKRGILQN